MPLYYKLTPILVSLALLTVLLWLAHTRGIVPRGSGFMVHRDQEPIGFRVKVAML